MRVLVAFASKRGGTAGLAEMIADALRSEDRAVLSEPAAAVESVDSYDAVIVAGALYMHRWHRDARRFVRRHADELRNRPVWFVSSGPLDGSARQSELPPVPQVARLMTRVGAQGHVTFGGFLAPDAGGFPAKAMAKKNAGDWRDRDHVREWADGVIVSLATGQMRTPGLVALT
jgi:menaquinone-dependent protoporphyrinogen oxidase